MKVFWRNYETYTLESWANGLAYALTHKPTELQVYVQGDDALEFERDRESVEALFPDKSDDEVMGYLWDEMDYGSAAVQK